MKKKQSTSSTASFINMAEHGYAIQSDQVISASEVTTLRRYTNLFIIFIVITSG